jgi:hypothetical protein
MRSLARHAPILLWTVAGLATVAALTWGLGTVLPPPFSGLIAVVLVGLVATELVKRQPAQRALRMFHAYLRARERGFDEATARGRLVATAGGDAARRQLTPVLEAAWAGQSEKERVVAGAAALLASERTAVDPAMLARIYDRARDRFTIPGWDALPAEFVAEIHGRVGPTELRQLDALAARYRLFHQRFFARPVSLGADPVAGAAGLARLLQSLGNRLAADGLDDALTAYRLSLSLDPADNLACAGMAVLLDRAGRGREAAAEAAVALRLLDARSGRDLTSDDLFPCRRQDDLRHALERIATTSS